MSIRVVSKLNTEVLVMLSLLKIRVLRALDLWTNRHEKNYLSIQVGSPYKYGVIHTNPGTIRSFPSYLRPHH